MEKKVDSKRISRFCYGLSATRRELQDSRLLGEIEYLWADTCLFEKPRAQASLLALLQKNKIALGNFYPRALKIFNLQEGFVLEEFLNE